MLDREAAQVRDHGHEDASDALLIERARQMVMIDQIGLALEAGDDRHHVGGEELGQVLGFLLVPRGALSLDLGHPERHLGRAQTKIGVG